ncbi:hypothetical protein [Oenococcus kitaharae]|uniref:Uncharacterized protein n=1 Tax=Oenococcus kitaharae DSM 17330 TaxID=1045004 RepID=G9WJG2_9LACO|nr:hypothetical protein [Oenococcus kitaharae]EHN59007.1 hypothetical protein OKIT_0902 [Oenococcus kitaharae DSM 17330]OEY84221.1 hypothetical protein NT95_01915 [Oenococcus kitaharae]OEY84795.1 hypothetical protein NT96_03105 [Oenococcus kitaharae]OEY85725.1 hypothetical protein NV75_04530 [Oenococcus kitaharae]
MKRSVVLSVAVGSLILVMSLGANAYQHSQVKQAQGQISRLQQQKRQVSQQLAKSKQQKRLLSTQIGSYKTYQNNKDKSPAELSFNTVVTKFFDAMNNFKPKTYGQRQDGVKDLISDKLYQQYFSNKGTYGDSNSASAKLNQLNLYTQSKQGQNMQGLAVVSYESKSGNNDWQKATVLYQVTFDTTTDRITAVQNLGSSFKASDLN